MLKTKGNLPFLNEKRKKVLAIGAVAAIALIFVSFLLSLGGDESTDKSEAPKETVVQNTNNAPKIPASQRYDYSAEPEGTIEPPATSPFDNTGNTSGTIETPVSQGTEVYEDNSYTESSDMLGAVSDGVESPDTSATDTTPVAMLYCGPYSSRDSADSAKATIAFEGVISEIVTYNGAISLKIGPFANRDKAKEKFNSLAQKGLVDTCTLVDE